MKKMMIMTLCALALMTGGIGGGAQAALSKDNTAAVDATAYELTQQLFDKRTKGTNIVFSPYSLQQMMPLIARNTTEKTAGKELRPYNVPVLLTETLQNTKTGSLILLDKNLTRQYTGKGDKDLRLVSYPDEALQAKEEFQQRILGSVIDSEAPQGNLNFLTAAHYYAEWETKFDKRLTKERPFTREDGKIIRPLTMRQHFADGIGKITDDYSMATVWGRNGSVVYFIKPKTDAAAVASHLGQIIADFDAGKGTVENIHLDVPKISVKNKLDLKDMLREMGLATFFDGTLYFDKITGLQTYELATASQTATLDINEDYAEGKAITEIGFRVTSAMPMMRKEYTILMDHPYFIVIKDRTKEGVTRVVFTAWIANPL